MSKSQRKYFIKVDHEKLVEVSKEVYTAYYQMERQERYQREKDLSNGLIYYDSWDTEDMNGIDYIKDEKTNIEEEVIERLILHMIFQFAESYDKYNILVFLITGHKEAEIAKILDVSQAAVNKAKKRLIAKIKEYILDNFNKN